MANKRPSKKPAIGISLMEGRLDLALYQPKDNAITKGVSLALPPGGLDDPQQLKEALQQGLNQIVAKGVKQVGVSVPTALLRQMEMPRLSDKDLFTALSSEAERYQAFQGVEAVADFDRLPPLAGQAMDAERVAYGALRRDRLEKWLGVFQQLKLNVTRVDIHINQMLRALAGSGVLDAVVQQAGANAYWGALFRGSQNVWFALFQATQLVELREVNMDLGAMAGEDDLTKIILENDIHDELRRTAQNFEPVAVWLADGLDPAFMASLSEKLGVSVQPCQIGPIVSPDVSVDLHPTAVGAALSSQVDFPFNMNFASLAKADKSVAKDVSGGDLASGSGGGFAEKYGTLLMSMAVASFLLAGAVAVILWGYLQFVVKPKAADIQQKVQAAQLKEAQLTAERNRLQVQYDTRASMADLIHRVIRQNRLFPALMGDLHTMTPSNVWVYELDVSNRLQISGKGMNDTAILKFAKQFDPLDYVRNVSVETIEEEFVNEQAIYRFVLSGGTRPEALTPPPVEKDTPPAPTGDTSGGSN